MSLRHVSLLSICLLASVTQAADRSVTAADAAAGKDLYLRECSGCHGERGRGDGPAADLLEPRPRDFTSGYFKFRTTPSGQPPSTSDIERIIEAGIPGTAMPSFSFLSALERRQITAHVLKLADLLEQPEPELVEIPAQAPPTTKTSVAEGKQLYVDAGCWNCHGDTGKGDGESAPNMKDYLGRPMKARDLTLGHYGGGGTRADLYYRLATGLNGTPMPSYGDVLEPGQMWALIDYVLSLRQPQPPVVRPADPIEAGRQVAQKYSCRGCHVLDDGIGGSVGPDLRVSARKLHTDWVRTFLKAPREYGKIYPWRVARMPHLGLSDEEIDVMVRYLAYIGKRPAEPPALPDVAQFPADKINEGKLVYMLRCTECHNLGDVIETPPAKQQGPDLIRVVHRVDFEWAKDWILNPKKVDPKTKMVVPDITAEQVEAVRMFIWKTAIEAEKQSRTGG